MNPTLDWAGYRAHVNPVLGEFLALTGRDQKFVRAEGNRLTSSDGQVWLDWVAGFGSLNLGHRPAAALAALMYPLRTVLRVSDAESMRSGWAALGAAWDRTIAWAQRLPPDAVTASVDGEWSFVETLRHLVMAIDKWFTAPILGEPFDPIGLPNRGSQAFPFPGLDPAADPSFDFDATWQAVEPSNLLTLIYTSGTTGPPKGVELTHANLIAEIEATAPILNPGPGVGGHCIAVDPWFIVASSPERAQLIHQARKVNDFKPEHVIAQVEQALAENPDAKVACLGLSYKPDVDDFRESPALDIAIRLARRLPGRVLCSDP